MIPADEEIREVGRLMEEATLTAQAHAVAMRRLTKRYREVFESVPAEKPKIPATVFPPVKQPPPRLAPPPLPGKVTMCKDDDFNIGDIPNEDDLIRSMIDSGLIEKDQIVAAREGSR